MTKGKSAAQLDSEIQQSLDLSKESTPPSPRVIRQMDQELKRLNLLYNLAASPEEKAIHKQKFDALALAHRDARQATRDAKTVRAKRDPTFVTGTNKFALVEFVLENGGSAVLPAHVRSTSQTHIKRCMMAGLLEPLNNGRGVHLTAAGKELVSDELIAMIERESKYQPRENTFVKDPEKRAELLEKDRAKHRAKIEKLEATLSNLRR